MTQFDESLFGESLFGGGTSADGAGCGSRPRHRVRVRPESNVRAAGTASRPGGALCRSKPQNPRSNWLSTRGGRRRGKSYPCSSEQRPGSHRLGPSLAAESMLVLRYAEGIACLASAQSLPPAVVIFTEASTLSGTGHRLRLTRRNCPTTSISRGRPRGGLAEAGYLNRTSPSYGPSSPRATPNCRASSHSLGPSTWTRRRTPSMRLHWVHFSGMVQNERISKCLVGTSCRWSSFARHKTPPTRRFVLDYCSGVLSGSL